MHTDYNDIKNAINRPPDWYDHNGTPRYETFKPEMLGIYDKQAIYAQILCQHCGQPFNVATPHAGYTYHNNNIQDTTLQQNANNYHYGDPPAHGCIGDTMNCIDNKILQAWERNQNTNNIWQRNKTVEQTKIIQDWAK